MSEQDNRELEHLNPELTDEEIESLLNSDESEESEEESDEMPESVKEMLAKKDAMIRQLHARAKKAESEKKNFNNQPKRESKKVETDDIRDTVISLKIAEQKRQFGYENGLSPEETDYLFKINPEPTKELLQDPFIKGGLEAVRAKKRAESNTPSLNSRSPRFELPKKKDLTPDDKQKNFESYMKSRFNK